MCDAALNVGLNNVLFSRSHQTNWWSCSTYWKRISRMGPSYPPWWTMWAPLLSLSVLKILSSSIWLIWWFDDIMQKTSIQKIIKIYWKSVKCIFLNNIRDFFARLSKNLHLLDSGPFLWNTLILTPFLTSGLWCWRWGEALERPDNGESHKVSRCLSDSS